MTFKLPDLPYDYNALEPYMDAKTTEIHHDKHHAGYTTKLNKALEAYPDFYEMDIADILADLSKVPEDARTAVRNNGGGYYHHNLWWPQLGAGKGGAPTGKLASAIDETFGGFDAFQKEFNAAAMGVFGSGWAWLVKDNSSKLSVVKTPNQDSPISLGLTPILAIDVWEHAYYLLYQNKRNEFVSNFWNVVDWDVVGKRF